MSVLLLKLAGPVQSWGESSRFARRQTGSEPTKSGIVGLLAAAMGRRRTDAIEDLAGLTFGVRIDQPGSLLRDFQTAGNLDRSRVMPLSARYYLSDAVFLAAVEGDNPLMETVADALCHPVYPLYLGRRSCPPAEPIYRSAHPIRKEPLAEVLAHEPWQASVRYQKGVQHAEPRLSVVLDEVAISDRRLFADLELPHMVRDQPVSFDPQLRLYDYRSVVRGTVRVSNLNHRYSASDHDPMAELGGH